MNLQYKTGYPYAVSNVSYPSIGLPMFPNGYPDINTSIVKYIPQEPNTRLKRLFQNRPQLYHGKEVETWFSNLAIFPIKCNRA